MKKSILTLSIASATTITGCSSVNTPRYQMVDGPSRVQYEKDFPIHKERVIPKETVSTKVLDEYYVNTNPVDVINKGTSTLPLVFDSEIEYSVGAPILFDDVASDLMGLTGIRFQVIPHEPSVQSDEEGQSTGADGGDSAGAGTDAGAASAGDAPAAPAAATIPAPENERESQSNNTPVDPFMGGHPDIGILGADHDNQPHLAQFDHKGTVESLIEAIAAEIGMKWRYDSVSESVFLYKYDTETFQLFSANEEINSETQMTTAAANAEGENSGGGENSQSITFSSNSNVYQSVIDSLTDMLSPDAKFSANPSLGIVSVSDNDYVLANVRAFIKKFNEDASRQVVVNVDVINVKLIDNGDTGINWTSVNQVLADSILGGGISLDAQFGNTGADPSGGINRLAFTKTGSPASYVIDVLNQVGSVTSNTSTSVLTMNNQPMPINITQNTGYISEVSEETDDAGNTTVTFQGDTFKDGLTMTVKPQVINDDVVLQYTMGLTVLDELKPVGDLGQELPVSSEKMVIQRIAMKNGQPMVVAAFERKSSAANTYGPFDPNLWVLGGRESYQESKEIVVIVVTPYVASIK